MLKAFKSSGQFDTANQLLRKCTQRVLAGGGGVRRVSSSPVPVWLPIEQPLFLPFESLHPAHHPAMMGGQVNAAGSFTPSVSFASVRSN
jgi:hypothetical protein